MTRLFVNDTATAESYTLSLHDALPIAGRGGEPGAGAVGNALRGPPDGGGREGLLHGVLGLLQVAEAAGDRRQDLKSTRLNSSHANISYAVFCLKKNNTTNHNCHAPSSH